MISRHWRALARSASADEYVNYLQTVTFPEIGRLPGFLEASIHRRDRAEGVEFIVITHWTSAEAVHSFSGADAEVAVVPLKVREMMLEYELRARHYRVVD
jgi:heme-degrading monooxygenase HmoA